MRERAGFRRGVLLAVTLAVIVATPPSLATEYLSTTKHYRFTVPDSWTRSSQTSGGADVAYLGPQYQGFTANLLAIIVSEPSVRDTEAWLLLQARAVFDQVVATLDVVTVQAPRSFRTAAGRAAADFTLDYQSSPLRFRQVYFGSDHWNLAYLFTFTAHQDVYASHDPVWNGAVDTFAVDGEASGGSLLGAMAVVAVAGAVAAAVVAFIMIQRRRAAPGPTPPMGMPPWAPPGAAQPPPAGQAAILTQSPQQPPQPPLA